MSPRLQAFPHRTRPGGFSGSWSASSKRAEQPLRTACTLALSCHRSHFCHDIPACGRSSLRNSLRNLCTSLCKSASFFQAGVTVPCNVAVKAACCVDFWRPGCDIVVRGKSRGPVPQPFALFLPLATASCSQPPLLFLPHSGSQLMTFHHLTTALIPTPPSCRLNREGVMSRPDCSNAFQCTEAQKPATSQECHCHDTHPLADFFLSFLTSNTYQDLITIAVIRL